MCYFSHMDDIEIYRAANVILKRHGAEDAALYCAQRADAFLEAGDMDGRRIWQRIENAVRELTRAPDDGDRVN